MTPLDRQLDRASRDRVLSAPARVAPADPSAGGSAQQAAPATPTPTAHDTGAALYGCECAHSRHAHRGYRECLAPGCTCWAYRSANQSQKNSARTGGSRPGA